MSIDKSQAPNPKPQTLQHGWRFLARLDLAAILLFLVLLLAAVLVGAIVGFIVISMYLPLFKVYDQIK